MEEHDRIEASIDRHNLAVYHGFGRLVDPNTVQVESPSGEPVHIAGKFILLATGSSPVQPDHVPFDHPCVVDADGVLELGRMPQSMIVVGGGVIGCEYACMFAEIGVKVTLVEPRPRRYDGIERWYGRSSFPHANLTGAWRGKMLDIQGHST